MIVRHLCRILRPIEDLTMQKILISEKKIVVVLFVLVIAFFSFAQNDTKGIQKMYIDLNYPPTISYDRAPSPEPAAKTAEVSTNITSAHLR